MRIFGFYIAYTVLRIKQYWAGYLIEAELVQCALHQEEQQKQAERHVN